MKCYNYNSSTKEYLGSSFCRIDPLETKNTGTSVWLLPANATFVEPPKVKEGYALIWNGNTWDYIEDHRGTNYWYVNDSYMDEAKQIKDLGPLPSNILLTRPERTEKEKLDILKAERANAVSNIIVTVDGMKFNGDELAQERMSRAVTVAKAINEDISTATTTWVLADNTIANPTIEQLIQALKLAGEEQTKLWTIPYTG